jgi:hypothetical protein
MYKFLLSFLLLLSTAAMAQTSIGVVAIVDGVVWRIPQGENANKTQMQVNQQIFEGDQILTGPDSFIKFLMSDDTVIDIGEQSKFSFREFKMGKTKEDRKAKYDFSFGKIRSIFSIKAKNEGDIEIKTPDIVMGVRGTEILADVYEADKNFKTDITLLHGKLNIKDHAFAKSIDINPGELFKSDQFKLKNDLKESIQKLNQSQMKQLALGNIMNKGVFLFDVLHKQKMPMHREVKSMMQEIKKEQPDNDKKRDQKKIEKQQQGQYKKLESHRPAHSPMQRKALTDEMRQKIQRQMENKLNSGTNPNTPPKPGSPTGTIPPSNSGPEFTSEPPGAN